MTAAPAKLAGVSRVVVCSPPNADGTINPLTLVAADIYKVDEVYKVGGVQAIGAMAYGTESIKPVKKIVGPGNRYVTMAKILVSRDVAIDMPAGPSGRGFRKIAYSRASPNRFIQPRFSERLLQRNKSRIAYWRIWKGLL